MKKHLALLFSLLVLSFAAVGFAADATFTDTAAVTLNQEPAPVNQLLSAVLAAIIAGATALLGWVSKNIKTWVAQKASEANTKESAAWYGTAFMLAGIAVRFAETKFGPDSGSGKEKKRAAVEWLSDRVRAIDKTFFEKTPNADRMIESFIDAAYAEAFNIVSPLAKTPGSSGSSTTSAS